MIEAKQPFGFDPDQPGPTYRCIRCGSSQVHVISHESLFCVDCRNMTTPLERIEWFVQRTTKFFRDQMDLEERLAFLRHIGELSEMEIEEIARQLSGKE